MYDDGIKFTLSVVVSANWCIADCNGEISFISSEDRSFLRRLMYGNESDCFIVGRKTYETMLCKVKKPYIVLSKSKHRNYDNKIFTNFDDLFYLLSRNIFKKPLILGGNEIYSQFLQKAQCNLKIHITIEEKVVLMGGIPFILSEKDLGELQEQSMLSQNTKLLTFYRRK